MPEIDPVLLDETGKVILDEVYKRKTPSSYYRAIERLDYSLPQLANPVFMKTLECLAQVSNKSKLKVVDLGCSYGINATLLKWDFHLNEIFSHYKNGSAEHVQRNEYVRRDQEFFNKNKSRNLDVIGVDISKNALDYAFEANILDGAVCGNFENRALDSEQGAKVRDADLIISTGCIGYVTQKTVAALLDAIVPKKPWMMHFVLRTFSFEDVERMISNRGYTTIKCRQPVRQRKFASSEEQQKAGERLSAMSVDTKGYEEDGWYYADFFLSRPLDDNQAPLSPELRELIDV